MRLGHGDKANLPGLLSAMDDHAAAEYEVTVVRGMHALEVTYYSIYTVRLQLT
jgi:hypothetical protein